MPNIASLRAKHSILVDHVQALGMIGVVRSLGSAGYDVHAVSDKADALGLKSNFAAHKIICPNKGSANFIPWLKQYIEDNDIQHIVPSGGLIKTLMADIDYFLPFFPQHNSPATLRIAFSKAETQSVFDRAEDPSARMNVPSALVVTKKQPKDLAAYQSLALPCFIKTSSVDALTGDGDDLVIKVVTHEDAHKQTAELLDSYCQVLIQGFVPGRKACVNVIFSKGEMLSKCLTIADHETPHSGGLTVLRHTFGDDWLTKDAVMRLKAMGWDGPAMMEYRYDDASGNFYFLEANTRFWANLHLDLFAGVDAPRIQMDHWTGISAEKIMDYPLNLFCRQTFPGEIGYLVSVLKDRQLSFGRKVKSILGFFLRFLDPRLKSDLLFPGDRWLYLLSIKNWLKGYFLK